MAKKIKKPKVKYISLKSLRKRAWKLQSEYIRRKEGGVCFTCGDTRRWQDQQSGHYIHKDCLDFDSTNIHCQCVRCNKWLHGNSGIYAEKLIRIYGQEVIDQLRQRANVVKKFNIEELEEEIIYLKLKLEEIK